MNKILHLKKEHQEQVTNVEKEVFPNNWTSEQITLHFENKFSWNIGLLINNKIVSYSLCLFNSDYIEILRIGTLESYRSRGFASVLISDVEEFAIKKSIGKIQLELKENNKNAYKLYTSKNFKIDSIRKKYYLKEKKDAILMSKIL